MNDRDEKRIVCYRCYVSGRVQGVFYRATTARRAIELGIRGWAKNLPDGRVEVLACGESEPVDTLREWLWIGPSQARVQKVDCESVDVDIPDGFSPKLS